MWVSSHRLPLGHEGGDPWAPAAGLAGLLEGGQVSGRGPEALVGFGFPRLKMYRVPASHSFIHLFYHLLIHSVVLLSI